MESPVTIDLTEKVVQAPSLSAFRTARGRRIMRMPYWHYCPEQNRAIYNFHFIHEETDVKWLSAQIEIGTIFIRKVDYQNYINKLNNGS